MKIWKNASYILNVVVNVNYYKDLFTHKGNGVVNFFYIFRLNTFLKEKGDIDQWSLLSLLLLDFKLILKMTVKSKNVFRPNNCIIMIKVQCYT